MSKNLPIKILLSVLSQLAGFWSAQLVSSVQMELFIVTQLITIFVLCVLFRFERRWILLNLIIPPAILLGTQFDVGNLTLIVGLLFIFLFLPTIWTHVPYYPTHREMYELIAKQLPTEQPFDFLDAGCGDGSLLVYLAKNFLNGRFTGVELSPMSFMIAWLNAKLRGCGRVTIRYESFWKLDFSGFTHIYAFLAPPPMPDLCKKAQAEMRPGSRLLVNSFPLPITANSSISLPDEQADRSGTLYIYDF